MPAAALGMPAGTGRWRQRACMRAKASAHASASVAAVAEAWCLRQVAAPPGGLLELVALLSIRSSCSSSVDDGVVVVWGKQPLVT